MTVRVPRIPIRLSPRSLTAALTAAIMSTTGSGDTSLNPSMQKWPAIEGDNHTAGACGNEPVRQTLVYGDLRRRVVLCEMSKKRRCVGMNDRQLERGLLARKD